MPGVGKRKRAEAFSDGDLVALHRARVVEWSPTAVTALAATADGTVVAVARESGSIEMWDTEHWQCIKVSNHLCCKGFSCPLRLSCDDAKLLQRIPGKENSAISCLAWTFDKSSGRWRLFSGGLDGLLTEWDLTELQLGSVSDSFGGAIWSLAVKPQQGRRTWMCFRTLPAGNGFPASDLLSAYQGGLHVVEARMTPLFIIDIIIASGEIKKCVMPLPFHDVVYTPGNTPAL